MSSNKKHMKVYMLDRYHRRRAESIQQLGGKCRVCESTDDLEIDHVDQKLKTMTVSRMMSVSTERLAKELENCQILCKDHHQQKSLIEQGGPARHGGANRYRRGCRCDLCVKNQKERTMRYKRKSRAKQAPGQ